MSLAVLERYSVLTEAMVARGALESAGIPAVIAEEQHAQSDPLLHVALQGFRLCVPDAALNEARAVLQEAVREGAAGAPSDIVPAKQHPVWVVAIVLGMITLGPKGGFLLQGLRDRGRRMLPVALVATPVILFGLAAFLFVLLIVASLFAHPPQ